LVHKLSIFPVSINSVELQHQRTPGDNACIQTKTLTFPNIKK